MPKPPTPPLNSSRSSIVNQRCTVGAGCFARCSARIHSSARFSDPAGTPTVRRGSPTPPERPTVGQSSARVSDPAGNPDRRSPPPSPFRASNKSQVRARVGCESRISGSASLRCSWPPRLANVDVSPGNAGSGAPLRGSWLRCNHQRKESINRSTQPICPVLRG